MLPLLIFPYWFRVTIIMLIVRQFPEGVIITGFEVNREGWGRNKINHMQNLIAGVLFLFAWFTIGSGQKHKIKKTFWLNLLPATFPGHFTIATGGSKLKKRIFNNIFHISINYLTLPKKNQLMFYFFILILAFWISILNE